LHFDLGGLINCFGHMLKFVKLILIGEMVLFLALSEITFVFGINIINSKLKIGLVENSFTGAAYRYQGFYDFYHKHGDEIKTGKNITSDLKLLTTKIPNYSPQYQASILEDLPTHLMQILPNSKVSILSDINVHEGEIFNVKGNDTSNNAYDILILGHQEYVTQKEYSNLKTFVLNGGTLIILTGNVFYAEVKYNKETNSITFVKGHGLQFDGKTAQKGVSERWSSETKQWLGSNFYPIYYWESDYHRLYNNPFNFTGEGGGEEQYYDKTNPNIKIILDYNSSDPRYPIATYELKYGKGKSIVIGLAAEDILDPCEEHCHKFYKFIDDLILNHTLASHIQ
jgi:N,N-dimethylformamidase beta subunit-like, C-terminal